MANQPRCLHCGGYRVTPPTETSSVPSEPPYLIYKSPSGGFLDQGQRFKCVGSACLDCGYVMFFLRAESLERARVMLSFTPWS